MMNLAVKEDLVEAGYLSRSQFSNLVLYNYTKKCEFEQHWTPETISSRGTIYDMNTGAVVARAFDKFFNVNQREETKVENLPLSKPFVSEKVDGSLGIGYLYNNQWRVATRGSFYSEQANMAMVLLEQYDMTFWPKAWTPLFEIVYPENRIITDYGEERALYLIGSRHTKSGHYMDTFNLEYYASQCGFRRPETSRYTVEELLQKMEELPGNDEGFVAMWPNGLLVKFKGKRYMDLARFKTNLAPLTVWEAIQNRTAIQFLEDCPDEFHMEALGHYNKLTLQFRDLKSYCEERAAALGVIALDVNDITLMKEKAKLISQEPKWIHGFLFAIMRGYFPDNFAWKMLRPENNVYVNLSEVLR